MLEIAYFATGCFWGAERRFWQLEGVRETSVGYMGGTHSNPNYEQVCSGLTGHAEIVKVVFVPSEIAYGYLLKEFWTMHDPTSLNSQGNDIGSQYRSAIYCSTSAQMELALSSRDIYQQAIRKVGYGEIVTEIALAAGRTFWLAEDYHQKYLMKNPNGYDCHSSTGVLYPTDSSERVG